jgi:transcriptional regulator with GAF, ATPase, and Fis domain
MTEAKYHAAIKELKKHLILDAVEQTQGSYADAARLLGVHPNYLHRLIRNLELKESLKDGLRDPARGLSGLSGGNA